jgi:hypothetical protein
MGRRKRTETEKNNVKQGKVDDFSVDKESQLKTFTDIKVTTLSQEIIDMFEIKPISSTGKFSGKMIKSFNEGSYQKSLEEAYRWEKETNSKIKEGENIVVLRDYYPQVFKGKIVLVSYDRVISR